MAHEGISVASTGGLKSDTVPNLGTGTPNRNDVGSVWIIHTHRRRSSSDPSDEHDVKSALLP